MITFDVPYPACPKPRPRFVRNGWAHLPPKYVHWKRESAPLLVAQAKAQNLQIPISDPHSVEILLISPSCRGDIDNWCGSVFDVLVQAGILVDDNLKVLPELTARWKRGVPSCTVTLTPIG
ncbi:RusA family crossover junction endodeoxyribonuclease [Gloeomargaritales cyanobacterium VI4D9]|nr:RusA family crossover junction endodeoxyribonuclease [Gloeomargaritales cyanobacterium VI4D9]WAS06413.1 RusA family crossover junction endodeoxyribonuclease [Gloeomargaritales cyanobacterium VI4D9]